MSKTTRILIGLLVVAVVGLGAALGVVLAKDDDATVINGNGAMMGSASTGYLGMMQAMGAMDSDTMLARMHEVLGDDVYARMMAHMQLHQAGQGMQGDPSIDSMMHQMMDGMMSQMPHDMNGLLPVPSTTAPAPTATATPTP